jgi:hypothetical protein
MSNHQADDLFVETLSISDSSRAMLILKPIVIKSKQIKKISKGMLLEGFDPFNLRIFHSGRIIARAKLGRIGEKEALYIVSSDSEEFAHKPGDREHLLEGRFTFLPETDYDKGAVIELDEPVSDKILLLSDQKPVAVGKLVDYNDEVLISITRVFHE